MVAAIGGALLAAPGIATAQGAYERIVERLAALGGRRDTVTTRRLADSVLAGAPSPTAQAEALYWRGMFAAPRGSGRADLLRLIIDHPSLARAADAQYALAIEDLGAGNRSGARTRLARVVRDHAGSANGADAAVRLGQLLLEDGDLAGGCAAFDSALVHLPAESVERRNQVNYARRPCERLAEQLARENAPATDTARVAAAEPMRDSTKNPPATPTRGARPSTTPPPQTARRPTTQASVVRWSAQVAAYTNRDDADRAAERLKTRGFDVRVTSEQPFRVRIGRYAVRSEAVALVGRLKVEGTNAILVEAERR
jgi:cell division septation protein DedD